jgi:hypothetical protein
MASRPSSTAHIELHGEKIYSDDIATIHLRKLSAA